VCNAKIARDILKGEKDFRRDVVVLNAGAAIYVTGAAGSLAEGVRRAGGSIDSGRASKKLEQLKKLTNT
jgi:anthranilate phosphoribosyltransferase